MIISCDFEIGFSDDTPIKAKIAAQNTTRPKDRSFAKQIDQFFNGLIKAARKECVQIFGKYSTIIAQEVDFDRLFIVSYEEVDDLLEQAAKESIDSLTLFTLPRLQNQKSFAIVFYDDILSQIQKKYDFHALFNIKGIADPDEKPKWMKGPLNVNVQSLILTFDSSGRKKILIQYDLFGTKHKLIDPIPIERLSEN